MALVHRLSDELLRIVFQLVIDARPARINAWTRLTEVCRAWKATMLENGVFWARVWSLNANVIRRMLVLSKDAPLAIHLQAPRRETSSPMAEIFGVLGPHMERVRVLHLPFARNDFEAPLLASLFGHGRPVPRLLESLNTGTYRRNRDQESAVSRLAYIAIPLPSLSSLHMRESMIWDHPLLNARLTHLYVSDPAFSPSLSLAEVVSAFQRMPCLEDLNYLQPATFRQTEAHVEDVRLSRLRVMHLLLPLEVLAALCSHLLPSNSDGSWIMLTPTLDHSWQISAHELESASRRVAGAFHSYLRASVPIMPTRMILGFYGDSASLKNFMLGFDQGTVHSVGLLLNMWRRPGDQEEEEECGVGLTDRALWSALPIRSVVLTVTWYLTRFDAPDRLWSWLAALRGVVRLSVKSKGMLLALLDALEEYSDLFPALERVEFESEWGAEGRREALERLRAVFGSARPQLSDLFLDAATFAVVDDRQMLARSARNVAVLTKVVERW